MYLVEREFYQDPEYRKKQSENSKKQFSDPEQRKLRSESVKKQSRVGGKFGKKRKKNAER